MKYYKILGDSVIGTDNLTQEDLVRAKQHSYDAIINRIDETSYDVDNNAWKPILNIDEPSGKR